MVLEIDRRNGWHNNGVDIETGSWKESECVFPDESYEERYLLSRPGKYKRADATEETPFCSLDVCLNAC